MSQGVIIKLHSDTPTPAFEFFVGSLISGTEGGHWAYLHIKCQYSIMNFFLNVIYNVINVNIQYFLLTLERIVFFNPLR